MGGISISSLTRNVVASKSPVCQLSAEGDLPVPNVMVLPSLNVHVDCGVTAGGGTHLS